MSDFLRYEHVQNPDEQFRKAALDGSAFTGCFDEEIGILLPFQQEILVKSYIDYTSMTEHHSTN
jgi:hypothetical protein